MVSASQGLFRKHYSFREVLALAATVTSYSCGHFWLLSSNSVGVVEVLLRAVSRRFLVPGPGGRSVAARGSH